MNSPNKWIEPMASSAFTRVLKSGASGAPLATAHPNRWSTPMRIFVLATSLLCRGGFAMAVSGSGQVAPEAQPLAFGWRTPLTFQVEETAERKGTTNKLLHTFSFTQTNGEYLLRWVDVKFLVVNGEPVNRAELQKAVAPARAMFLASPPMRIGLTGEFLGTLHTREALEQINRQLDKAFPDRPEDLRQFYKNMAENPEGQKLAETALSQKYWTTWVEAWEGLRLVSGQCLTNSSMASFGQRQFPVRCVFSNLGSPPHGSRQVRLRFEQTASGKEVGRGLMGFVDGLANAAGRKTEQPFPEITNAIYYVSLEVQTDPSTLQPSWAKRTVRMAMDNPEVGKVDVCESYEFKFLWGAK